MLLISYDFAPPIQSPRNGGFGFFVYRLWMLIIENYTTIVSKHDLIIVGRQRQLKTDRFALFILLLWMLQDFS